MPQEKKDRTKRFIIGGISGCSGKTFVAPLDRVKILIQGQKKNYANLGPLKVLSEVYKESGIRGLFQGNLVQLVRIFPYSAVQFLTFSIYSDTCKVIGLNTTVGIEKFISGALAGMTACTCTYPLDLIRARLAFQDKHAKFNFGISKENMFTHVSFDGPNLEIDARSTTPKFQHYHYRGIIHAFMTIIKQEKGLMGLYKGFSPTLIGMAPYAGTSFYTFENLKKLALTYVENHNFVISQTDCRKRLTVYGNLICGSIAGLVAQTVSYPLDVVRRTMQLHINKESYHRLDGKRRTWWTVMRKLMVKYGVKKGLYRGMTINYMRVVPVVSVTFTVHETLIHKI